MQTSQAELDAQLQRLEHLARLLDSEFRVPGTNFRFGLDGIIGLIPGIGDVISGLLSSYLIMESRRMGARKRTMMRMMLNTGVDLLIGAIPFFGDLFDFAFKANKKNVNLLLKEHMYLNARNAP